jgi:tripartite-type tricarboxylate transporter receptor subunit TctC
MPRTLSSCIIAALLAMSAPAVAQAQDPFAGKQIILLCGAAVGGGYDLLARLMARHFGRLIPGNPTVIVQNMPAAGSLAAANYIYNTAPRDGTVIALIQRSLLFTKLTNPAGTRFELDKLNWLGSLASEVGLSLAWATAPVQTMQELLSKELIVGAHTGVDPETTPRLYNAFLGTKFKIITGYSGTADIGLAMERGEVQGIGDWSWSSLKKQKPDWIREHKVTILTQGALKKDPELPDVPMAIDFAKADMARKVLTLYFTQKTIARPIIAPPGIAADRLNALRTAFAALATDKEFLADAERSDLEVSPIAGPATDQIIAQLAATSPDVLQEYAQGIGSPAQQR